jgi:hypothetical protein
MQTSIKNDLQSPTLSVPDPSLQRSTSADQDAPEEKRAHLKIVRTITLPEDVVTLTDSNKPRTDATPAKTNSSIPVTGAEKQALLGPVRSGYNFSIYG